jgi:hypothetical protein
MSMVLKALVASDLTGREPKCIQPYFEIKVPVTVYLMASLDPGLQLMIEIAIGSVVAVFGIWKLKKRTDRGDSKNQESA